MNTTNKWIILLLTAFVAGGSVTMTTIQGGCSLGMAIFAGAITGATAILHNLAPSANDTPLPPLGDTIAAKYQAEQAKLATPPVDAPPKRYTIP